MIVIDYIYYCAYCLGAKRSEGDRHARTVFFVFFILICILFSIENLTGLTSILRKQIAQFSFLEMALCFPFCLYYFAKKNKNRAIVARFDQSIGEWKNLHAFNGFLFFVGGMLLFWFTKTHYDEMGRTILPIFSQTFPN